jgi:hypothetical protein
MLYREIIAVCSEIHAKHIRGIIVMYVPFSLIVLFCVLFVCEYSLYNCHRDIGPLFDYPN